MVCRRRMLVAGPNLTIDRTATLDELRPGAVLRFERVVVTPGGKGLNVARAARALGVDALLVGFVPGETGRAGAGMIAREGIALRAVAVRRRAALDRDRDRARRAHDGAQRAGPGDRGRGLGGVRGGGRGRAARRTACSSARAACRRAARTTPTLGSRDSPRAPGGLASSTPRARRWHGRSTAAPDVVCPNVAEAEEVRRRRGRRPAAQRPPTPRARAGRRRGARRPRRARRRSSPPTRRAPRSPQGDAPSASWLPAPRIADVRNPVGAGDVLASALRRRSSAASRCSRPRATASPPRRRASSGRRRASSTRRARRSCSRRSWRSERRH